MNDVMIEQHLENLDRGLARVEQILSTLATRDELHLAIAEAVAPLATKDELRHAIAEAVAPLVTKDELRHAIAEAVAPLVTRNELDERLTAQSSELRQEIREEGERSRRYMDVLIEGQRGDIRLIAEHLAVVISRLDRL